MNGDRHRAFSLIELLVVVTILGVLIALMVPGLGSALAVADSTRCASNLGRLFKAENTWRADRNETLFTQGTGWSGLLMPYLEEDATAFACPSAVPRVGNEANGGVYEFVGAEGSFTVQVWNGSLTSYSWSIPIGSPWMQIKLLSGNTYHWGVEDQGQSGGGDKDFNDVAGTLWMYDGIPYKVRIDSKESACNFKLEVNGKVVVENCATSIGTEVEITEHGMAQAGYYGLSRGTYDVLGQSAPRVDAGLFLLLDYAKPVADYNEYDSDDDWNKFFITDPDDWQSRFGNEAGAGAWQQYQSLRHGGRANVLFCDGHIELLGPDDMGETSPFWRYSGR